MSSRIGHGGAQYVGEAVVAVKWIALEGTAMLAREGREQLLSWYPSTIVDAGASFDQLLSVSAEQQICEAAGVTAMQPCGQGGVFGGLWNLAETLGVGLDIDLRRLPVRQETIEICNYFDLNPYQLLSGGCLLAVTERSDTLLEALYRADIHASVIGRTTKGPARIIHNGEGTRYLEKPRHEEIERFYTLWNGGSL